jgi:short-chain 2-methylacyl-CoA dehydrogenase
MMGTTAVPVDADYEELGRTVAAFADSVIAPVIGDYYERAAFPYEIVRQMGEMGLFGLPVPEDYGGMGGDYLALCTALEELARVDSSTAITLEAAVSLGIMPIYRYGTEEQRRRWLPELTSGRMLAAFGLTEPGAGSDAAGAMRTTARLDGGEWVINGTKAFITNSGTSITGVVAVAALTSCGDPAASLPAGASGSHEISVILVPAGTAGMSISRGYSKVGWLASDTHELSFSDCRVPHENLLGDRGQGYRQLLATLDEGRVAIAALATGLARGCLDQAVSYSRTREAFGRLIAENQAIQFKIADMASRAHLARLAWRHAAARMLAGERFKMEAAMAKLAASDAAMDNARDATQIFGGYGFMNEYPVARFYRDAKILEIGEGTSEIQRILIARELGLPA